MSYDYNIFIKVINRLMPENTQASMKYEYESARRMGKFLSLLHLYTVGRTPWKLFLSKLKNHLKTFKMHQKVIRHLNFVHNLTTNYKDSKIVHAKVTSEVIFLWLFLH